MKTEVGEMKENTRDGIISRVRKYVVRHVHDVIVNTKYLFQFEDVNKI